MLLKAYRLTTEEEMLRSKIFSMHQLPTPRKSQVPHIGSATFETRHAMAVLATSNLLQALAGEQPEAVFGTSGA